MTDDFVKKMAMCGPRRASIFAGEQVSIIIDQQESEERARAHRRKSIRRSVVAGVGEESLQAELDRLRLLRNAGGAETLVNRYVSNAKLIRAALLGESDNVLEGSKRRPSTAVESTRTRRYPAPISITSMIDTFNQIEPVPEEVTKRKLSVAASLITDARIPPVSSLVAAEDLYELDTMNDIESQGNNNSQLLINATPLLQQNNENLNTNSLEGVVSISSPRVLSPSRSPRKCAINGCAAEELSEAIQKQRVLYESKLIQQRSQINHFLELQSIGSLCDVRCVNYAIFITTTSTHQDSPKHYKKQIFTC